MNIDAYSIFAKQLIHCFEEGGKVFAIGNGGSDAQASHFAGELLCKMKRVRRPLPVITLNNPVVISAIANDFGFEVVFSRQIMAFGKQGDILIAFSTSGKSPNVLSAIAYCRTLKIAVIDVPRVGGNTQEIQEFQLAWVHQICAEIEEYYAH